MITEHLKKRFCKDNNLNINIYEEPYFSNRLELISPSQLSTYQQYINLIETEFHNNEEEYFAYYNNVKDAIINYIKESSTYNMLQTDNMNNYSKNPGYPSCDIYKETNIGKHFVSIDMNKANFTALVHYGRKHNCPFAENSFDYIKFIQQFTKYQHIVNSKYIRQVVFGNCNPKRQITYETHLMICLLNSLIEHKILDADDVYSVRADEIILSKYLGDEAYKEFNYIVLDICEFPVKIEAFKLRKITNSQAYVKQHKHTWGTLLEPKCVSPDEMPFVYKTIKDKPIDETDMIFSYNGKLAKFLDVPKMEIIY